MLALAGDDQARRDEIKALLKARNAVLALSEGTGEIHVDETLRRQALVPLERMLAFNAR